MAGLFHSIRRALLPHLLLLLATAAGAGAAVRVSQSDGRWGSIDWLPEGPPSAGDTVIISTWSVVEGMPPLGYGKLIVRSGATLVIEDGSPMVTGLLNEGTIVIERPATLGVAGSVLNIGSINGDGVLRMAGSGATISGMGAFTNLLISAGPGGSVALDASIAVPSLTLAPGNRLLVGPNNLTVNGPYNASVPAGPSGIVAGSGTIFLNGIVYGSARGAVVIGVNPNARPSKRAPPPLITGVLGDTGKSLTISASRRLSYSTLVGDVRIDSGVSLMADGIGSSGANLIVGTLRNRGTLSAGDEGYRWTIEGELFNAGTIESCTLVMKGRHAVLRSDSGLWDPGIILLFTGRSDDTLTLRGALSVSRLRIEPASSTDSNLVVNAGGNWLKVRHSFTSDSARGCRLVSDTVVSIWGAARGIIVADLLFEGFWGSEIGGTYGGAGRSVIVAARKTIAWPCTMIGSFVTRTPTMLRVAAPLLLRGDGALDGESTIERGERIVAEGSLTIGRSLYGGGTLRLIGAAPALESHAPILDSIRMELGGDSIASQMSLTGTLRVPKLFIHAGSSLHYHGDDTVAVADTFRHDIFYHNDFNMAAVAARPFDPLGTDLFAGASSTLFRYRGGYTRADTVAPGEGYFVSFPAPVVLAQRGRFVNLPLTIPVRAGWNLIGGASLPASAARVTTAGTSLLSSFVTSIGGTEPMPLITPGTSYWVNVSTDGSITFNADP